MCRILYIYMCSGTSVARTLMARMPRLFKLVLGSNKRSPISAYIIVQSTLVISTSVISNNRLSRRENLIPVLK